MLSASVFGVPERFRTARHEYKKELTKEQMLVLRARAAAFLAPDSHYADGRCEIASLYFDDASDSAYHDKVDGDPHRRKYRVRVYDRDPGYIVLECKEKYGDRIIKRQTRIDRACCNALARGDIRAFDGSDVPLCRETAGLMRSVSLRPKLTVSYTRTAFSYPLSNLRVTFDEDLCASDSTDLFDASSRKYPVWRAGLSLLEIKYDDYLPSHIATLLTCSGETLAVSKYVACRDCLESRNIIPDTRQYISGSERTGT